MDRDQVLLAVGHPVHKSRETKDGMELEDWVYGTPPGKITFVTFNGNKVIKVKEAFAGLGQRGCGAGADAKLANGWMPPRLAARLRACPQALRVPGNIAGFSQTHHAFFFPWGFLRCYSPGSPWR